MALAFGDKSVTDLPGGPKVLGLDFQPAVTEIARQQKELHYWMLIVCTLIFVVVFGFMFYSIFKHRKSVGHKAANFHESVAVEIAVDDRAVHHRHPDGRRAPPARSSR